MPLTVNEYTIKELAHVESKSEVFIKTNPDTSVHLRAFDDKTIIWLPYGNKFEVKDGRIIIYSK